MNRGILLLIISCLFCLNVNAQSHKADFIKALNANNMTKAEEILKAWDFANSNDPELYIAYFNFYSIKSQDSGQLSATGYDVKYSKQALDFITEGIERFPTRFDMRIAKLALLRILKNYPAYVEEVLNMIRYSKRIENNWKREEYMILDKADNMFYDAVFDSQVFLYSKRDPNLYPYIIRISEEMLKYYPQHIQSVLSVSTVFIAQKEYDKSVDILTKALVIEPENAIVMFHLANVYNQKGDKVKAKKYYELMIANCQDNEEEEKLKESAKKRLLELK